MSSSNIKSRHYAALSSRLRQLRANLAETESSLEMLADRLGDMSRLGISSGAQFMAVSRLLDVELQRKDAEDEKAGLPTSAEADSI
ncbi:hypothetical protein EHS25_000244 [Saitozyma podzolica]|uniref:Uncharacterized protein n=1 Tax=Saitozyma podzolica TaxID=1890683 RepID=A0A427YVJ6_9TREE|nr:hypothetical protein EHS25_000244 [Saitozyma podzolica]